MIRRPSRTFLKYLVVQIPGWFLLLGILLVVGSWVGLPGWSVGALLALGIVKDLALYPLLRHAYEGDPRTVPERLVGFRGSVAKALSPEGYIRVRGELWHAEATTTGETVPEGTKVRICSARGLTLTVQPERVPDPTSSRVLDGRSN